MERYEKIIEIERALEKGEDPKIASGDTPESTQEIPESQEDEGGEDVNEVVEEVPQEAAESEEAQEEAKS